MANFDGSSILDWVKAIAGNIFIAIMIVRSIGQYARSDWGDMATSLLAGLAVAAIIYFPDQVIALLKKIVGGGGAAAGMGALGF